ncbi:hypothetical protein OWV82_013808 [Melia azedarach]|uniref:Uncharacterized protein n=1 Tax=Melia azedarach TaxID=155640 RepID=A0ACC1XWV8_MELAZ|nr:hypothetical protein OWV82_013808 [Melia azedarach]
MLASLVAPANMASGESETQDVIIQIDGETSCIMSELNWLESIMKGESENNWKRRQIFHKVPEIFRGLKSNKGCFDPLVVSIGPYHHGKPELKLMEEQKFEMALQLYNGDVQSAKAKYNKLKPVSRDSRNCYAEDSTKEIDEEEFNRMMFLDGSFVSPVHLLLENQLPYEVLKQLMSFHRKITSRTCLKSFIQELPMGIVKSKSGNCQITKLEFEDRPAHLLAFFRSQHIGTYSIQKPSTNGGFLNRSATQLKAAGIIFGPSRSSEYTNVNFKSGCLELPILTIDDSTKSILLNMIAYESFPDGPDDLFITSYVCFMDSLIDDAEDVRLLRSWGIVPNFLGKDQQVADLFNQIATNTAPNPIVYAEITERVKGYYRKLLKVWMAQWLKNNFSFIAFFAGTSALILSIIQTYFAAYSVVRQ